MADDPAQARGFQLRLSRLPSRLPSSANQADLRATSPVSDALSRDLKDRGFRFVGSTIVYAFMQATGLVDDHLPGCFRYREE